MATILKSFDWSKTSKNKTEGRSVSYPWDEWLDGRIWRLEPNEDFDGPPVSLERTIRTTANRRHLKVRIRITEDGMVVVQRHDDEEPVRHRTHSPRKRDLIEAEEAAIQAAAKNNGARKRDTKAEPVKIVKRRKLVKA
jgi:hypothetical protein